MNKIEECKKTEDYFDGELEKTEVHQYEVHLERCERCQMQLKELRELEVDIGLIWARVDLGQKVKFNLQAETALPRQGTVNSKPVTRVHATGVSRNRLLWLAGLGATLILGAWLGVSFWQASEPMFTAHRDPLKAPKEAAPPELPADSSNVRLQVLAEWPDSLRAKEPQVKVQFDEQTMGVYVPTETSFSVYRVFPKITYSETR